jgi:transcriptional regulator with XRE-family HTH domain
MNDDADKSIRRPADRAAAVELGKRLAAAREKAGKTQEDAGYATGFYSGTVSRWELGKTVPSALTIRALADLYGVSADELLREGASEASFVETPDWLDFLKTDYGLIAKERGLLDELKRARIGRKMTSKSYETLVHMMLSEASSKSDG